MTVQSDEFKCVLCASTNTPNLCHDRVKGDLHNKLKVVRCIVCGHFQLSPPNYSIDHYKEDGQVNFVVHDYGTPLEKIVEHSWIEATRRVKRFRERGIVLERNFPDKPLRVLDIGGGVRLLWLGAQAQVPRIRCAGNGAQPQTG